MEGYDNKMPVFAIEVEEDMWNLYIVYANGSTSHDLVCLGPESMGDTRSHQGVFKLIHVLNGMAEWGGTECRAWFGKKILTKYQSRLLESSTGSSTNLHSVHSTSRNDLPFQRGTHIQRRSFRHEHETRPQAHYCQCLNIDLDCKQP